MNVLDGIVSKRCEEWPEKTKNELVADTGTE